MICKCHLKIPRHLGLLGSCMLLDCFYLFINRHTDCLDGLIPYLSSKKRGVLRAENFVAYFKINCRDTVDRRLELVCCSILLNQKEIMIP